MFFLSFNVIVLIFFLIEVPNQKYKISTKSNRIYDLTERKVSNTAFVTLCYNCRLSDLCVVISVFAVTSAIKLPNILSFKYRAHRFG